MSRLRLARRPRQALDSLARPRRPARLAAGVAASALLLGSAGVATVQAGGVTSPPIRITSDTDFASCACVTSGTGTAADPFVIGPLAVQPNASGDGVFIDGSALTKSFRLFNLTVNGSAANGVHLVNINSGSNPPIVAQVAGGQTTITGNGRWGVLVEHSSSVTLDSGGANPTGPGVATTGFATSNKNFGGIDLEHDSNIVVRGWQLNGDGADSLPDWACFRADSWGGGGLRMFDVTSSTVDHNASNNSSDSSFNVFDSSSNTISNNTGGYPYTTNILVTLGSANNVISGNAFHNADYVGYLVADPLPGCETWNLGYGSTHGNILENNTDGGDGPTGHETNAGIAPSFVGGTIVLNGSYGNTIRNNVASPTASVQFGWAQAVPSSTSPIGVLNGPPYLQCNVTASSGGSGGVAKLNDNVWTGNTYKTAAPCTQ